MAALIVTKEWNIENDPHFSLFVPLNRLGRWAYWLGNALRLLPKLLFRQLRMYRHTQTASFDYYQQDGMHIQESKTIESDHLRFMIYKNKLGVSLYSNSYKFLLSKLVKEIQTSHNISNVLDFGCGAGMNSINLKNLLPHLEVVGFDFPPPRVFSAKKMASLYNPEVEIFLSDGKRLGLKDKSIDLTFTSFVLEQLNHDSLEALKEMGRVTKRKIVLFEPDYDIGNFLQKAYIRSEDFLRGVFKKIEMLQGWKITKYEKLTTYAKVLSPAMMVVLEPEEKTS